MTNWKDEVMKSVDLREGKWKKSDKEPVIGFTVRYTEDGHPVFRLHYLADPVMRGERLRKELGRYISEPRWRQEMEIDYEAQQGSLVYPEFSEAVHVVQPSMIPRKGCRFCSIDPHPRTPHAVLWVLLDAWNDWYIYRELWPSVVYGDPRALKEGEKENQFTIREYAETIAILEGNEIEWFNAETQNEYGVYRKKKNGEEIVYRFMDQAGKAFSASGEADLLETYARRYTRYGIPCRDPRKSHEVGEDAIHELLAPRQHDVYGMWPRLHVSSDCPETVFELKNYRYKQTKVLDSERDLKQEAIQARCHMIDNLRYISTAPQVQYIRQLVS